jgi:hypothetical protein
MELELSYEPGMDSVKLTFVPPPADQLEEEQKKHFAAGPQSVQAKRIGRPHHELEAEALERKKTEGAERKKQEEKQAEEKIKKDADEKKKKEEEAEREKEEKGEEIIV